MKTKTEIVDMFGVNMKDEIRIVMDQYSLNDNPIIEGRLEKILKTELFVVDRIIAIEHNFVPSLKDAIIDCKEEVLGIIRNVNVFDNELLEYEKFPSGPKTLGMFLLCYKKPCQSAFLGIVSDQPGAAVGTLADKHHCTWAMGGYKNATIRVDNQICRKITGIDYNADVDYGNYVKVSKDDLKDLFKNKRCPLTGKKGQRAKFQLDHRIPVASCKEQAKIPAVLTLSMLHDGSWKINFQVLSQEANMIKQGACGHCRMGGKIWVPPAIESKQESGRYIEYYSHDCTQCYWYDCEKGNR